MTNPETLPLDPPARRETGPAPSSQRPGGDAARERRALVWLGVITLVGAVARFATLDAQSLWLDEASTVNTVLHPGLGDTLATVSDTGYTPHLYFLLAWLWSQAFGLGEFALRSLSALAGTATIVVAYAIGRELRSSGCGLLLAALVAVHGALFWYSQELRPYALYTLLVSLSFLFFLRARRTERTGDLVAWGVISAAAIATHYYAGFFVAVEAAWLLAVAGRRERVVLALVPIAALSFAYVPVVLHQAGGGEYSAFGSLGSRVAELGENLFDPGYPGLAVVAAVVCVLALLLAARMETRGDRAALFTCTALAAIVLVVPVVLALAGVDFFLARNLLPVTVVLLAAVAVAITSLSTPLRIVFTGVLVGLLGVSTLSQMLGGNPQRPDWRAAADTVQEQPGVRIVMGGNFSGDPIKYYLPAGTAAQGSPTGDAVYRARFLDLIGQCGRDLQGMLAAEEHDCEWSGGRPAWVPDAFQQTAERRLGNVMVRSFAAPRPTDVNVTRAVINATYAAFVLPQPSTQGRILVTTGSNGG